MMPSRRHAVADSVIEIPPAGWIDGNPAFSEITEDVARPLDAWPGSRWFACFAAAVTALAIGAGCVAYEMRTGIGVWGLNKTVGWAFDITNFVFWVGIGHAGTLISAILLLFRQRWRTSINRAAEAMTIFAVMCAALFPLIHMGRPWLFFFVLPYPNSRGPLWVNFRSPLLWDVFAINTYLTISLVFWYVGMIPDFATLRDRAGDGVKKTIYGLLSLGWNGSHRTWSRYETLSTILAGLATPLVISVHSIVSMDFATSILPGWHTTMFPPYFVAGAVYSGFGMVMTLLILTRQLMHLKALHHAPPSGRDGENHAPDRFPRGVLVRHRVLLGVAGRQSLRTGGNLRPRRRTVRVGVLDDGRMQRGRAAAAVVAARPDLRAGAVRDLDPRQRRHVVRALRDYRHVAAPELPAVDVGDVHADDD